MRGDKSQCLRKEPKIAYIKVRQLPLEFPATKCPNENFPSSQFSREQPSFYISNLLSFRRSSVVVSSLTYDVVHKNSQATPLR